MLEPQPSHVLLKVALMQLHERHFQIVAAARKDPDRLAYISLNNLLYSKKMSGDVGITDTNSDVFKTSTKHSMVNTFLGN